MTGKHKVLLVDDEPLVLDSLREIVVRDGKYQVSLAENGRKAMEMANSENFAVIITDLMLMDTTGNELLKTVKTITPETQVIMVSGKGTIDLAVEAMKMGSFDFLTNPFSPPHLLHIFYLSLAYYY